MVIDNKFEIGETVYLKSDPEQFGRIVTAIFVHMNDLTYEVTVGSEASEHYDFEISRERNVLIDA